MADLVTPGPDQYIGLITKVFGHGRYNVMILTPEGVGSISMATKAGSIRGKTSVDDIVLCEIPEFRLGSASRTSSSQHIIVHHYHEGENLLMVEDGLIGRHSRSMAQAIARGESLNMAVMTADVGFDFVAPEENVVEDSCKTSKKDKRSHRVIAAATAHDDQIDFERL